MFKKLVSAILIIALALSLCACGGAYDYTYGPVSGGASASDPVVNNGRFIVQKGNYLYYINSFALVNANNEFGEVIEGALMRSDLDGKNITTILPKLIANTSATGLYIIGDRIYFTSPCDEVNAQGVVQSNYLDLLSVKLDGTDCVKHATIGSTAYPVYFMEENGSPYAVYVAHEIMYSIKLDADKPKSEVLSKNYTGFAFCENGFYVSEYEYVSGSEELYDRYTVVSHLSPSGKREQLFTGKVSEDEKYLYIVVDYLEGKLFYEKRDIIVSLEDSFCYRDVNGTTASAETRLFVNCPTAFMITSYPTDGVLATHSSLGLVFADFDGNLKQIKSSTIDSMFNVVGDKLFYFTQSNALYSVYYYDLDELLEDSSITAKQFLSMGEVDGKETFDTIQSQNFAYFSVINGEYYYYSGSQELDWYLWKYNAESGEFTCMSKIAPVSEKAE
ncbi:MAG: hypothetical protein IJ938_00455 [Clostridia bacterium]|nr:hypothetical protein [Clostridia bacterium]